MSVDLIIMSMITVFGRNVNALENYEYNMGKKRLFKKKISLSLYIIYIIDNCLSIVLNS